MALDPKGVGMRLFKIRGSLEYYARQELSDEVGSVRRLDFGGQANLIRSDAVEVGDIVGAANGVRHPIRALDFTIAAPKSVSVQWGLASEAQRVLIEAAHHDAVVSGLRLMVELDSAKCSHGVVTPIEDLVAFDVGHRLSRAGDPHLHSHLVVINNAKVGDRTVALDHDRWARGLPVYELCYRSELAHRLRSLNIELAGSGLGPWRIMGQPESLLSVFSKRRHDVEVAAYGSNSSRSRQLAALNTRPPKLLKSQAELRSRWEAEAAYGGTEIAQPNLPEHIQRAQIKVRVNDPLLNEYAKAIEQGASGIQAATEIALKRALGEERALELLLHGQTALGGSGIGLDGTLCQSYRSLSVTERLKLIDTPVDNLKVVAASREIRPMVQALEQAGLRAGDPVVVTTRTAQETALIAAFGNYRGSSVGPTLVVDANALPPSDLRELVGRGPTVVRIPGESVTAPTSRTLLGLQGAEGRALVVTESAGALWEAFVDDCARWVKSGCREQVYYSARSAGLVAKLRREVAALSPDSVAGYAGSKPIFRGERVVMPDGRDGTVIKLDGSLLEIRVGESRETFRASEVEFRGFATDVERDGAVTYGIVTPTGYRATVERTYLCQAGVGELSLRLFSTVDSPGISWIQETAVKSISQARMSELARTNGKFLGEELYRLRENTNTLSRIYDRAEELGLDDRRGRDRILDERLALRREMAVKGHGIALSQPSPLRRERWLPHEPERALEW